MQLDLTPRGAFLRRLPNVNEESLVRFRAEMADSMEAVLAAHHERKAAIDRDVLLTAAGKEAQRKALADRLHSELAKHVGPQLARIRTAIAASEQNLLAPAARHRGANSTPETDVEIRALVRGMSQPERDATYQAAARSGDAQTVRAIEQAPRAFPLIAPELIEREAPFFAAAAYPTEWQLLVEQRAIVSSVQTDFDRATAELYGTKPGAVASRREVAAFDRALGIEAPTGRSEAVA